MRLGPLLVVLLPLGLGADQRIRLSHGLAPRLVGGQLLVRRVEVAVRVQAELEKSQRLGDLLLRSVSVDLEDSVRVDAGGGGGSSHGRAGVKCSREV